VYYNSVKLIRVESPCLACIYYTLAFTVLSYVIFYTIIWQQGYQEYDVLLGTSLVQTKGIAYYTVNSPSATSNQETTTNVPISLTSSAPTSASISTSAQPSDVVPISINGGATVGFRQIKKPLQPLEPVVNKDQELNPQISFLEKHSQVNDNNFISSSRHVIFDANDLVPPLVPGGTFIATAISRTWSQTRGICPGNDNKTELCKCPSGNCCMAGQITANGVQVGECSSGGIYCNIEAWCPLERDEDLVVLDQVSNWATIILVNGEFPEFGTFMSNTEGSDLQPGVNLFSVNDLLNKTNLKYNDIKTTGAVLMMAYHFDCNLNKKEKCTPWIEFKRLDKPNGGSNNNSSSNSMRDGYSYRFVDRYQVNGTEYRALTHMVGIRLIVSVQGKAGRFSLPALSTTLGSGLALVGVGTLVCDVLMQYVLPQRNSFLSKKFEEIEDDGEEKQDEGALI